MLKKFFNNGSKSTIRDFLFWLLVYPFVIAFAVACVAFIFSFSEFKGAKITDWILAISTVIGVYVAWRVAQSWKQQKAPDLKKKLLDDLIDFGRVCFIYNDNPQKYLDSLPESKVEILRHMSIIDIGFKSLKFFDSSLSEILVKKIDDFDVELNKLFKEKEKDKGNLTSIFGKLIDLGSDCEQIILGKDGSS